MPYVKNNNIRQNTCLKLLKQKQQYLAYANRQLIQEPYYDSVYFFIKSILFNLQITYCKTCKCKIHFSERYKVHCSTSCSRHDPQVNKKIKNTTIKRYGSTFNIIEKRKKTMLSRYNVENYSQTQEFKIKLKQKVKNRSKQDRNKINKKRQQTCEKKYGVKNISQLEETKQKKQQTCLNNYGVKNGFQSEKTKTTLIDRYGTTNLNLVQSINEKRINTFIEKYGTNTPLKNKEIIEKIKQTNNKKYRQKNRFVFYRQQLQKIIDKTWNNILSWHEYIIPLFSKQEYIGRNNIEYKWKCAICGHQFVQKIYHTSHMYKISSFLPRCLNCFPYISGSSLQQKQLVQFCKQYYPNLIQNDRELIKPLELDIVIPEIKLAIEFNGNFWHSLEYIKDRNYHLNKVLKVNQVGYRLIHIWQDQWNNKRQQVKNKLRDIFCRRQIFDFRQDKIALDRSWYNNVDILNYELVQQRQPKGIEREGFIVFDCGCLIYRKRNK